jgi:hypothetical protein
VARIFKHSRLGFLDQIRHGFEDGDAGRKRQRADDCYFQAIETAGELVDLGMDTQQMPRQRAENGLMVRGERDCDRFTRLALPSLLLDLSGRFAKNPYYWP